MKTFCFCIALVVLSAHGVNAKIINGYEQGIADARTSLQYLRSVLNDNLLSREKRKVLSLRVQTLVEFLACHRLTDDLLLEFRNVSPWMYNRLDSLTDARGRVTDVYVRFMIPNVKQVVYSVACMSLLVDDRDRTVSEFGMQTVSISIWISSRSMELLAHEFGHVYYQVPNLRSYAKYYSENYGIWSADANCKGHEVDDPSGKQAMRFEQLFRRDNFSYNQKYNAADHPSPMVLIGRLKRRIYKESLGDQFAAR